MRADTLSKTPEGRPVRLFLTYVNETKNGVLDVLQRFECREGRRVSAARSVADHLRPATETAALAVLVHLRLDPAMFTTLYQPFSVDIPPTLLFGLTE